MRQLVQKSDAECAPKKRPKKAAADNGNDDDVRAILTKCSRKPNAKAAHVASAPVTYLLVVPSIDPTLDGNAHAVQSPSSGHSTRVLHREGSGASPTPLEVSYLLRLTVSVYFV